VAHALLRAPHFIRRDEPKSGVEKGGPLFSKIGRFLRGDLYSENGCLGTLDGCATLSSLAAFSSLAVKGLAAAI